MLNLLLGRKTYLISIAMGIYAVAGFLTGNMDGNKAIELLMEASGLSALRAGVSKS